MSSQIKTGLLLGLLTAIILFLGGAMGGRGGLYVAFVIAVVMNLGSYWYSDKIVLSMYRAQELSPVDAPALHQMVGDLARNAGVPMPRIALIPEEAPNAFATGRNPSHAVVAVTQGIMRLLSPEELKAVLAHEMGHVKNRDILIQSIAATLAGAIMYVASMIKWGALFGLGGSNEDGEGGNPVAALLLAFIAPVAAMLIQMGISRSREFLADETGAKLSGTPEYLASALEKLTSYSQQVHMHSGNPATAHMFIVNPFAGQSLAKLFSTHPPVEERVRRLRAMVVR